MRRIVSLGADSRFAVCDDGAVFFWTGNLWEPWDRPPIPQPTPEEVAAIWGGLYARPGAFEPVTGEIASTPPAANAEGASTEPAAAPKRGPGRPRKNT